MLIYLIGCCTPRLISIISFMISFTGASSMLIYTLGLRQLTILSSVSKVELTSRPLSSSKASAQYFLHSIVKHINSRHCMDTVRLLFLPAYWTSSYLHRGHISTTHTSTPFQTYKLFLAGTALLTNLPNDSPGDSLSNMPTNVSTHQKPPCTAHSTALGSNSLS